MSSMEPMRAARTVLPWWQELVQEKQKMEDLLYLTLPFPVARYEVRSIGMCALVSMLHVSRDIQLKKRVSAEKIGPVTIYHSDIVNFTDLFSDSTPFEVSHRTSHLEYSILVVCEANMEVLMLYVRRSVCQLVV